MTKFVIETHLPYCLHPSEGPGMLITVVIFDGKNYDLWEAAVRTELKAKNKLGFIDGTQTKPTIAEGQDPSKLQAWDGELYDLLIDPSHHQSEATNKCSIR